MMRVLYHDSLMRMEMDSSGQSNVKHVSLESLCPIRRNNFECKFRVVDQVLYKKGNTYLDDVIAAYPDVRISVSKVEGMIHLRIVKTYDARGPPLAEVIREVLEIYRLLSEPMERESIEAYTEQVQEKALHKENCRHPKTSITVIGFPVHISSLRR